ncbi:MAG: hypothetical protein R3F59_25780 [Myxococcota bacterium]
MLVVVLLSACSDRPAVELLPGSTPTGTPAPSGTSTAPATGLPAGWEHRRLARGGIQTVSGDWAIGTDRGLVRWNGTTFDDLGQTADIDPVSSTIVDADTRGDRVWALGLDELAWSDGGPWTAVPLPDDTRWDRLLARADGTVVLVAADEWTDDVSLATWDGAAWTVQRSPADLVWVHSLTETASGVLVVVGDNAVLEWDEGAGAWIDRYRAENLLLDVVADGEEIIAVGAAFARGPLDALVGGGGPGFSTSVDVGPDGTAWALGSGLWYDDGAGWQVVPLPPHTWQDLVVTATGVRIGGDDAGPTLLEGDRSGVAEVWRAPAVAEVRAVWVDDDDAVWLATETGAGRWDETFASWELEPGADTRPPPSLFSLAGTGPSDVFATSDYGVQAWDGATWTTAWPLDPGDGTIATAAVAPDGTAFVSGRLDVDGSADTVAMLLRRDAGTWSLEPAPIGAGSLSSIVALGRDEVYGVTGDPAALVRYDGTAWTTLAALSEHAGVGLWGDSGADLYLPSERGRSLLHWDGVAVTEVPDAPADPRSIAVDGDTLLVGVPHGAWLYRDGAWSELDLGLSGVVQVALDGDDAVIADGTDAWRGPLSAG